MVISLLAYLATFLGQLYFLRSYFFTHLQSNCFHTTVTLSEQLFLQSSCFFEELRFRKSRFLAAVIFSEQLIFRSKTSTEHPLIENMNSYENMAVTFWNSHFFGGEITQNKVFTEELLCRNSTSAQHQLFQKSYFEKANFSEKKYSAFSIFLESYLFRATIFSKGTTVYNSYLFRRATSHKILFQKSFFFTATLPLHSYNYQLVIK